MVSARHKNQTLDQGLHSIVAFSFSDDTERLAATGFLLFDLYKLAIQLSDNTFWLIISLDGSGTPIWQNLVASTGGAVGGDLSGSLPNPTVIDLTISGQQQGSLLYYNGANWVSLNPGVDGYVLTTHNAGNNPTWTAVSGGSGSNLTNTAPVDVTKASASVGTSLFAARGDHKHDILTGTAVSSGPVNSEGTSNAMARADHTHQIVDLHIVSQAKGDLLYFDGTNWVVLAAGQDGYVLTANGVNQNPGWEQPSTPGPSGIAAGTQVGTTGAISFVNSNGISFGMSNSNQITASYTVPNTAGLISGINVSGGTTSNNLSAITFSNSNGLAFGLNGSVITGSYTVPNVPSQTAYVFSNSNGLTFGTNGSTVTASYTVPTQTSISFSNANGISFGIAGSTLTASYTVPSVPAQTNQTEGFYAVGNTIGQSSSSTFDARTFSISGAGIVSVGYSAGNLIISVPPAGASINFSAGTTSNNLNAITFSNSNGMSFGLNGSIITGSYTVPTQTNQTEGRYAIGNTVGQSSSSTFDARTLSISGVGNISVGYSGNALLISGAGGGVANQAGTQTATSGTVVFSNSNGISFGMSNSSVITASYTVPNTVGLISSINISAGTTSNNLTNFVFSNSNNVSFGLNGSTITATVTTPVQSNQSIGFFATGNTTQNSSTTLDARSLTFNGLGGASVGYSNGSIQISAPTTAGLISAINVSAGTTSNNLSAITFSNSNGLSFGLNGSTITGSYTVPTQTAFIFSNSNGISFGTNASTVTASYTVPNVPAQTNQTIGLYALGNTTQNSSTTLDARTLSFNGLGAATVGFSNGSIQVSVPVQTAQTQSNIQAIYDGVNSISTGTIRFSNANGLSFGVNGQTITGSYTVPSTAGLISNINISAGTTSNNLTALTFSNSNGLSFGLNGSVITGSYTIPSQSAQTEGMYALGNTVGQSSSSTFDARTLSISGMGNISLGYSNNALIISGSQSNQTANIVVPSAGTQSATSGTVIFSNSNGISFGMSNSSVITASYTIPTQTNQTVGLFALGNTTQNSSTTLDARSLSFNGVGIITAGYSNGSIQISATQSAQTAGFYAVGNTVGQSSSSTFDARSLSFSGAGIASVGYSAGNIIVSVPSAGASINVSAGTTSSNLGALVFGNSNGVSFGLNAGTITATVNPGPAAGIAAIQGGTQTATSGTVIFSNSNGISFGLSNSSVMTASYTVPNTAGLISFINVSGGTTSNNLNAITFSNSNGMSFGLNGSTITGSYTVPTQTNQSLGFFVTGNTTQNSSTTLDARSLTFNGLGIITAGYSNGSIQISATTAAQTNQTIGLYALGNTTQNSSTTLDARSLSFNGLGVASIGYSNGSIQISVPNALTNINVSAGTTSNNLTNFVFSNSNNVSFGLNGSTITATVTTPVQTAQTVGLYGLGNTTQNSSTTLDARSLSFDGLGIITVGYSNGSIQLSATQSAQTQNVVVPSAGTQTAISGTVIFSNSNGITFGMSNSSVITASYTVPSTAGLISQVNISAGTTSNNLTNFIFSNSNGLAFGLNGSTITGSYTQAAQTSNTFSNSNNVSFTTAGGTIVASASFPAQTNQTIGLYGLGNTTQNSSTTLDARSLSFNGLGAATVGYSNGSIQVSVPVQTSVNFSNANGISFGLAGSTLTASYTVPTQTNQSIGLFAIGNTTQNSSTTLDARTLSFNGLGGATVGYSNGSIQISGVTTIGLISGINISAGTTSNNLSAITFNNLNGISFGLNASIITASYTVPIQTNQTEGRYAIGNTTGQSSSSTFDARTMSFSGAGNISLGYSGNAVIISGSQSIQTQNIVVPSAGTQTAISGTAIFSNSNGISFGMSNSSVITASYTVPSTAGLISFINVSGGTTSNNLSAITFSNSNGMSFGLNGSIITGSYTVPTQTVQTVGVYAVSNTTGASSSSTVDARSLSFQGAGIASVGYTNGSIVISVPSGANVNISAGTTSNNLTNFVFSNSNGLSFGLNGSTITGSYTVPTQTNQTEGRYAIGNTVGQSSSSTFDARTMSISGAGIVSVGYSGNALIISAPSAGGSVNFSAGTTSNNLNAITFSNLNNVSFGLNGSVITASIPNQNFVFSNSNNVSFGIAGSTITASASRPQVSLLNCPDAPWQTNFPISNASFSLQHFNAKVDILATQANLLMNLSGNTNSSGALTISIGAYTMFGSTMGLISSDSRQITWTSGSQTTASSLYGGISGTRYRTVALNNWSLTAGAYIIGVWFRTTNNGTWNAFGVQGPTIVGAVDANETGAFLNGYSVSSYTTGMLASENITNTNYVRTGGNALQQPGIIFLG